MLFNELSINELKIFTQSNSGASCLFFFVASAKAVFVASWLRVSKNHF
jgi:hypothetical protein